MTTSEAVKAVGLKSINQVSAMTGQSRQTLDNWHKHKQDLFFVVLQGCVNILNSKQKAGNDD